jgi:excisionase family DNA binding protein
MELVDLREAAERIGVSIPTLKRYIYEGKVRSVKLPGGRHRIPIEEVERVLTGAEAQPTDSARAESLEERVLELEGEVERLAAALMVLTRYVQRHVGVADTDSQPTATPDHRVLVLGTGCKRCDALYETIEAILSARRPAGVALERVTDLDTIAGYGPLVTPAVIVDDRLVLQGRVPTTQSIEATLDRLLN